MLNAGRVRVQKTLKSKRLNTWASHTFQTLNSKKTFKSVPFSWKPCVFLPLLILEALNVCELFENSSISQLDYWHVKAKTEHFSSVLGTCPFKMLNIFLLIVDFVTLCNQHFHQLTKLFPLSLTRSHKEPKLGKHHRWGTHYSNREKYDRMIWYEAIYRDISNLSWVTKFCWQG